MNEADKQIYHEVTHQMSIVTAYMLCVKYPKSRAGILEHLNMDFETLEREALALLEESTKS